MRYLIVLLMALSCYADLGETEAQIKERYGEVVRTDTDPVSGKILAFKHAPGAVMVHLTADGTSWKESFLAVGKILLRSMDFLEQQGKGMSWSYRHVGLGIYTYTRADDKVSVLWIPGKRYTVMSITEFINRGRRP